MKYCPNCGAELKEGAKFCPKCGAEVKGGNKMAKSNNNDKTMGILSYLGFLALIPFFAAKDSKFATYHAKQGMNLLIIEVAYSVISTILSSVIKVRHSYGSWYGYELGYYMATPWWLTCLLWVLSLGFTVLSIIGIVNVVRGKQEELPIVGKVKIIK